MRTTVEEIREKYNNGEYKNKIEYPSFTKYKEDHIFNEDQTVKWNREQVKIENDKIVQYRNNYNNETNHLTSKLKNDVEQAIVSEYGFNQNQASIIYDYAYREKHSNMNDVFYFIDEIAELIKKVNKTN